MGCRPAPAAGPLRTWLILEGGGAKGLVHVGALRALEAADLGRQVDVLGLAGTSAGAMVAALAAAGYSGTEMLDADGRSVVLENAGAKRATDLFGPRGWRRIKVFRWLVETSYAFPLLLAVPVVLAIAIWMLIGHFLSVVALVLLLIAGWYMLVRPALEGLCDTSPFIAYFNRALAVKLGFSPDQVVMFKDLRKPLRIVATDINTRSLKLFSSDETPDVPVARAVAASIALPMIFRPLRIGDGLYFDGGLVSNLPAWAFDEERALDPDTTTIAIEIPDGDEFATDRSLRARWQATIKSAVFGGGSLNKRMVDSMEVFRLPSGVPLLDFDMPAAEAARSVQEAEEGTRLAFSVNILAVPQIYERACRNVHSLFAALAANTSGCIRVSIVCPVDRHHMSMRVKYGYNMRGYTDDRMLVPERGSRVRLTMRDPYLWVRKSGPWQFAGAENRYLNKLVWRESQWAFWVPVRYKKRTMIVGIDSDMPLEKFGFAPNPFLLLNTVGFIQETVRGAMEAEQMERAKERTDETENKLQH